MINQTKQLLVDWQEIRGMNLTALTVCVQGFIRVEPNTTYIISGLSLDLILQIHLLMIPKKQWQELGSYYYYYYYYYIGKRILFKNIIFKPDQSDFAEEELQKLRKTLMFNKGGVALPGNHTPAASHLRPQSIHRRS